jgi:hypothetical protein
MNGKKASIVASIFGAMLGAVAISMLNGLLTDVYPLGVLVEGLIVGVILSLKPARGLHSDICWANAVILALTVFVYTVMSDPPPAPLGVIIVAIAVVSLLKGMVMGFGSWLAVRQSSAAP